LVGYLQQNLFIAHIGQHLVTHPTNAAFGLQGGNLWHAEAAAAVVEQPTYFYALLQGEIGNAVRLEVVALRFVHRNEDPRRLQLQRPKAKTE
jgi:hypothetical protein